MLLSLSAFFHLACLKYSLSTSLYYAYFAAFYFPYWSQFKQFPACLLVWSCTVCLLAYPHVIQFPACLPDLLHVKQFVSVPALQFLRPACHLVAACYKSACRPTWVLTFLQFVCLVCILSCFVCEAGKCVDCHLGLPAYHDNFVCLLIFILHNVSAWCFAWRQSACMLACLHTLATRLHATHLCLYLLPCMLCSFIVFLEAGEERHL